ncbi:putative metal-nicotianamine transporter YSL3 [Panicum miliaceum]|uniref:Metal-nicotianamine transporter YSL3 n=1 Tax=Panicum miliaceum TaxID=4540 RepID=A0A3L6RAH5_PANMI|nr:putative metal-nicotianamine transporter YSL3 [Panicum miliaceum]
MDSTVADSSPSVEQGFEGQPYPGFWRQVTLRSMAIAAVLATIFSLVTLRIYMTIGVVGALNMPANVLGYFSVKSLVAMLRRHGIAAAPFTRQENIFLQTCVMTCVNIAISAKSLSNHPDEEDIIDRVPTGKYALFLFLTGLVAVTSMLPLMQVMIVDYRLPFPTGSVVAHLINSFHTPQGAYVAKFFFDFSPSFVGLGMIVPHVVNFGLLFGAITSWGILFPFLDSKRGQWYHTDSTTSLNGANGYKIFIGITMIITEGIFNFIKLLSVSSIDYYKKSQVNDSGKIKYMLTSPSLNYDDRKRLEVLVGNQIPLFLPVAGYIGCAIICSVAIPWIFHHVTFYHMALLFVILPIFTFCNTYGTGLTDWSVAQTYARFLLFIIAALIAKPGAIIASLAVCGVAVAALNVSSQAMQDLKTGYMTLTNPRAVVAGHIYGVLIGSIINPCIFLAFEANAKDTAPIGSKDSGYPCPSASIYRAIGLLGKRGLDQLPDHCITFCLVTFLITLAVETLRLVSQKNDWKLQNFIPCITAIALPYLTGPYYSIDMTLGSVLLIIWGHMNRQSAELLSSAVAAGLICGDGIWALPSSILSIFNVHPPICMKFLASGKQVHIVDSFVNTLGTR